MASRWWCITALATVFDEFMREGRRGTDQLHYFSDDPFCIERGMPGIHAMARQRYAGLLSLQKFVHVQRCR